MGYKKSRSAPSTPPSKSEVKRLYAIRRRRQRLAIGPLLAVLVMILIWLRVTGTEETDWLKPAIVRPAALLALLYMIGFSLFNWRCPRCNAYLGAPKFSYKRCLNCDAELR